MDNNSNPIDVKIHQNIDSIENGYAEIPVTHNAQIPVTHNAQLSVANDFVSFEPVMSCHVSGDVEKMSSTEAKAEVESTESVTTEERVVVTYGVKTMQHSPVEVDKETIENKYTEPEKALATKEEVVSEANEEVEQDVAEHLVTDREICDNLRGEDEMIKNESIKIQKLDEPKADIEQNEVITNKYTTEVTSDNRGQGLSEFGNTVVHENIAFLAQCVADSEQDLAGDIPTQERLKQDFFHETRYEDDIIANDKAIGCHDDLHSNIMQLVSNVERIESAEAESIVIANVYGKAEMAEATTVSEAEPIIVDNQRFEIESTAENSVESPIVDLQMTAKNIVERILDQVLRSNDGISLVQTIDPIEHNKATTESNLSQNTITIQSTETIGPQNQSSFNTSGNSNLEIEVQSVEEKKLVNVIVKDQSTPTNADVKIQASARENTPLTPKERTVSNKSPITPPIYSRDVADNLFEIAVNKSQHIHSTSLIKQNDVEELPQLKASLKTFNKVVADKNAKEESYFDIGPEYAVPIRDFVVKTAESKKAVIMNQTAPPLSPYINNEPKVPEDVQALIKGLTLGSDADSGFDGSSINVTNGLQISPNSDKEYFKTAKEPTEGERRYTYHSHIHKSGAIENISVMTRTVSDPQQVHFKKVSETNFTGKISIPSSLVAHDKADGTIADVETMLEEENIKNVEDQIVHTKKHLEWLENQQVKLRRRYSQRSNTNDKKRNSSALESQSINFVESSLTSNSVTSSNSRSAVGRPSSAVYLSPDLLQAVKQLEKIDPIPTRNDAPETMVTSANHDAINNNNWRSMSKQTPPSISKPNQSITSDVNANDLTTSSTDLQQQLAELDACIAQLTSSITSPPEPQTTGGVVMRHKRSYSSEIDRQLDPNLPVNGASNVGLPAPTPPSRTRSSFNSVSRLSQEFDSKKMIVSPTSPADADEVFAPPYNQLYNRSKFPPQTSMTRRQQVSPEPPAKTMGSLEDRLSPDLVTAMITNPGARPKENIHSYREDLDPTNYSENMSPVTPGFPPPTPASLDQSASPRSASHRHELVGLAATPLSVLHLKPKTAFALGTHNSSSSPVARETNLLSDESRPHQLLEEKISREQQLQRQQINSTIIQATQYKVTEQTNRSPGSQASYSAHGGSEDSLDGDHHTRHSNSSLLSSSSSSASSHRHPAEMQPAGPLTMPGKIMRNGGQHLSPNVESNTPNSGRTSASSLSDIDRSLSSTAPPPVFVHEAQNLWYKPDFTREQALDILRHQQAGSFVVRDSRCFPGAYGLALKVDKLPANVRPQPGVDLQNELVRHFLIEPSSRGVKLKGCPNEPVFGSLPALVYQHSITPLALPCRLLIPKIDPVTPPHGTLPRQSNEIPNSASDLLRQGAACNVVYIASVETESLTGTPAIERAIHDILRNPPARIAIVHFKVSPQGVTLTDNARKIFFRRHYPTNAVTYCGLDPRGNDNRRYDTSKYGGRPNAWMFGFVARKQNSSDNVCHIFAELEEEQPGRAIVNFVSKVLIRTSRT